jgi:hypothetical protein
MPGTSATAATPSRIARGMASTARFVVMVL